MRDQFGLLPATIRADYEREEMVDRQVRSAFALYHALQDLDRNLDLVFISDRADPEYGITPGRWHVLRKNPPPAPDSYMAIVTESGGYREPDSGVLEELRQRDLWRGLPQADETPSAQKEFSRDEGRVEELAHDLRAGSRVAGEGGLYARKWGKGR